MTENTVQDRQGSSYSIVFPDFPSFDVTPQNVTITQEMGSQDIVELTYPRFSSFYIKALKTGVPVHIRWSNDSTSSKWVGYVYSVKKNTVQSLNQPIIVKCIPSLNLKEGGSKIWTNKTAPDIVTEIAKKFKLTPVVTPNKVIFSQQSLSGHSYWEKIQELATRIGYVAHLNGAELHFHPLDKMIDRFMTTIPIMSYLDSALAPYASVKDQTLDVFRATLGDYTDAQDVTKKEKNVFGVDPLSATLYSASSSADTVGKNLRQNVTAPLFTQTLATFMSGSKEMAKVIADAQAQFSRFVNTATGAGQGHPLIGPYRTMELKGTGEDTDGYWITKKVVHFLSFDGRYEVEFSCMNDGRGLNKASATRPSTAGTVPTRNLAIELATGSSSTPTEYKLSAPTILVNQTQAGFKSNPRTWVGM